MIGIVIKMTALWRNTRRSRFVVLKVLKCLVIGHEVEGRKNTHQIVQVKGKKYQLECYRCSLLIEIVENVKIVRPRKD